MIIDEAQDLELSLLRLLVALCCNHKYLLVTADANESIYPVWTDVHGELDLSNRIWMLRTGQRTTWQIMDAALTYIREGIRVIQTRRLDLERLAPNPSCATWAISMPNVNY